MFLETELFHQRRKNTSYPWISNTTCRKKQLCILWNILINQTTCSKKTINKRRSSFAWWLCTRGAKSSLWMQMQQWCIRLHILSGLQILRGKNVGDWSQLRTYFLYRVFNYQSFDNGLWLSWLTENRTPA